MIGRARRMNMGLLYRPALVAVNRQKLSRHLSQGTKEHQRAEQLRNLRACLALS
jgi:hypothetical protein